MAEILLSGGMKVLSVEGDKVIFGSAPTDATWGDDEGGRPVAPSRFEVDKKYWKLIGSPEEIAIGFSTPEGWQENWNEKASGLNDR